LKGGPKQIERKRCEGMAPKRKPLSTWGGVWCIKGEGIKVEKITVSKKGGEDIYECAGEKKLPRQLPPKLP